jgi:hypothetical protein
LRQAGIDVAQCRFRVLPVLFDVSQEDAMNIVRTILTASVAGMLVAAPVSLAQAVDAHQHGQSATTKKKAPKKKPATTKQVGQMMAMGGMKMGGAGMHGAQAGKGGMMQCPMMSKGGSTPMHSPRMQWHHSMMMWHHKMMHGQSMHGGS